MKGTTSSGREKKKPASNLIDQKIREPSDWRESTFARIRELIKEADPEIAEEVKWRKPSNPSGVPVWYLNGGVCTGETYKDHIKLTFFKGASLEDPAHLFTQPGTVRRAIDFYEGDTIDELALKDLIRAAVALNAAGKRK